MENLVSFEILKAIKQGLEVKISMTTNYLTKLKADIVGQPDACHRHRGYRVRRFYKAK